MPTFRLSTEYGSKYNRELWDKATRSNYYQLVDDRRNRMLRASCHAPIHWEHVPEIEEIVIATPEPLKHHKVTTLADVKRNHDERMKKLRSPSLTSKLSPPPPKAAWADASSRCSEYEHLEWEPSQEDDQGNHLKRTSDQRSPTPAPEGRKKVRTPSSIAQRQTPLCRPQSAPNSQLSQSSSHTYVNPNAGNSRPRTASSSRMSLDYEKTHGSVTSPSVHKVAAPFAASFRGVGGVEKPRQVKDIPRIFERNNAIMHKSADRVRLEKVQSGKDQKKVSNAIGMSNMPKDMALWVTEYQGNFKNFKPF